jgi:hypothetical protein
MSCIIKSPNPQLNKASLKEEFHYLDRDKPQDPLSRISATDELRTLLWSNAITVATVIKNVCLSRCRKADSISYRRCIRTLASFTHFVALKPNRTNAIQSVFSLSRTGAVPQNAVPNKPYAEMSRMSNQQKAEFISDIFHMRSFWGGHGEISPKTCFIQVGMICQKCCFSDRLSF